jgi:hypothetical protein
MRLLGFIVAASIGLALFQAAVKFALVVCLGMLIWLGVTRPAQTLGFLLTFTALGVIGNYPIAGLVVFGGLALVGLLGQQGRR